MSTPAEDLQAYLEALSERMGIEIEQVVATALAQTLAELARGDKSEQSNQSDSPSEVPTKGS